MKTSNRSNVGAKTNKSNRKPLTAAQKKVNVSNSIFIQPVLGNGARLGIDMALWANHPDEKQYIADIEADITKAQAIPMCAFYNDVQRSSIESGDILKGMGFVDPDGNSISISKEQLAKMIEDANAQEMGEAPEVYKRKDHRGKSTAEYEALYGRVLGWVNWFFVKKNSDDEYQLVPAPRGTALRAALPGHWKLHKELRIFHGVGRLFAGRAVRMSGNNSHIESKSTYRKGIIGS